MPRTGVLFLNAPLHPAADTRMHALLIRALDRSRFEVHVAASPGTPGEPSRCFREFSSMPDVSLRATDFGPSLSAAGRLGKAAHLLLGMPGMLGSLFALAAYVRSRGIRIIHSLDRPRDATACAILGALTGARTIVHLHTGCGGWMRRTVHWSLRRADAIVGVSAFVARTATDFGYPPGKVHAVLNAIDPGQWDFKLDRAVARRELGIAPAAKVVLSASRLFHWKGQAELVRALALARREHPDAQLWIAGEDDRAGSPDRPSYAGELRELSQRLGLSAAVKMLGWRGDLPRLLAACDVFGMPSFEEPFGLVFAEAMAMKRPVLGLDNGGTPEVVEHGQTGLLSPPGDIDRLAENLRTLLSSPELRARFGERGRRCVEERFHPARMARDAERVYDSVLSG